MDSIFFRKLSGVTYRFHSVKLERPAFLQSLPEAPPASSLQREEEEAKIEQCVVKPFPQRMDKRVRFTHFLSLPVRPRKEGAKVMAEFHESVRGMKIPGFQAKWLKEPATMHFTLLMLALPDEASLSAAVALLRELKPQMLKVLQGEPLSLGVRGLGVFGRVGRARVVYAQADHQCEHFARLERLTTLLIESFLQRKLAGPSNLDHISFDKQRQLYQVQYHVTVINCKYGRGGE